MKTQCPSCNAQFEVPREYEGKKAKCKKCTQAFLIAEYIDEEFVPVEIVPENRSSTTSHREVTAAALVHPVQVTSSPAANAVSNTAGHRASSGRNASATPHAASASPISQRNDRESKPTTSTAETLVSKADDKILAGWNRLSENERMRTLLSSFRHPFTRPKTASRYKMGLMAATGLMLAVPVLYALFIFGIVIGIYLHCVHNVSMFQHARGRGAAVIFGLYIAPIVIGSIVVLFLSKPFFAPRARKERSRSLTPTGEPLLFAFVSRICEEVGAPTPKRIDINNEVNAAASFRAGFWSMLRGNDLVLHIGMPLVSGLSLQQLTGVLSHEFGHFSQGAGMRVSNLLISVSSWLHRAVYDRDAWDEWLETTSQELDLRLGWVFYLTRGAVWLSRKLLWCLMMLAYVVIGYVLKQMEYDADRYEAGMVGKKTFQSTSRRLRELGFGYQQAMGILGRVSQEGKLVDNFPLLAESQYREIPKEVGQKLDEIYQTEKTEWYESHPCDRDRVHAVQSYPDLGSFQSDLPARAIFQHYEAECIGVTRDFYDATLGNQTKKHKLVSSDEVIVDESKQQAAWAALYDFFLGAIQPQRTFALPRYQVFAPEDIDRAVSLLTKSREMMPTTLIHYETVQDVREYAEVKQIRTGHCDSLKRRMSDVDTSYMELPPIDRSKHTESPDPKLAETFVKAATIRLHTACCLMAHPDIAKQIPNSDAIQKEMDRVLPVLQMLDNDLRSVLELSHRYEYLVFLFGHFDRMKGDKSMLARDALAASEVLVESIRNLRGSWMHLAYPFDHATANRTIGEQLTPEILSHEDVASVAAATESLVDGYHTLRGRCIGSLVVAATSVEKYLGLAPITLSVVDREASRV